MQVATKQVRPKNSSHFVCKNIYINFQYYLHNNAYMCEIYLYTEVFAKTHLR